MSIQKKYYIIGGKVSQIPLNPNKKSIEQVIEYLHSKFNIAPTTLLNIGNQRSIHRFKLNCINSLKNQMSNYSYDDLEVLLYTVCKDEKSAFHYEHQDFFDSQIWVNIEKKLEFVQSNCQKLQKELYLYKGISEYDILNKTSDLMHCLMIQASDSE